MKILKQIVTDVFKQAKAEAPLEACGYLAGKDGVITESFPMTNIDRSETHFSFDPEEQFNVMRFVREKGLKILGVYHSHPETPARPSAEDIRLAYDPDISYVIASTANNLEDIESFKIKQGKVTPEPLEII
ncbi:MAG: M67 family metallopeptidase [Deltaproteobacteria bacterium]|nr:M67 family metallopeptidase [Deltaproteobacteria bacterium]